ncbi:terminase small subunit [Ruegeria phage vB_RpoS-V10]|nr:hypothetical protein DSS3P8_205 [Roseobacter phage DSS3P8]AWY09332.1 terminase small subunit [Ruegeria phage vB_RpoS-V10]
MPKLEHEKHEMFCHFIARGNLPLTAYVAAGYPRNLDAALALIKVPMIAARIAEIQPTYDKKYRSRESPMHIIARRREEENART